MAERFNTTNKSLLDLPPEVWIKICVLAVTYDSPISIAERVANGSLNSYVSSGPCWDHADVEYHKRRGIPRVAQPAITRVCRPIRLECLRYFYGNNMFIIYGNAKFSVRMSAWLDAMGAGNRTHLKHLYYTAGARYFAVRWHVEELPDSNHWTLRAGRLRDDHGEEPLSGGFLRGSRQWMQRIHVRNK